MKTNRIYLQNFRSHRESDINLDRVNLFLGRNNAGKTSVLTGLEWGLTGRCCYTDRAGRGAGDLIKTGAAGAVVLVDLDGAGQAVRTLNPNGLTFGGEATATAAQAKLYERLGTGGEDLRAALNVGAFLSMSTAGQKTYLFSVLGPHWDMETVLDALDRWLEQHEETGPDARAERLKELVRPLYPPQVEAGPEVLDLIEKKLRDARRDTKRDLARVQALLDGSAAGPDSEALTLPADGAATHAPGVTPKQAQARLAGLRQQRDRAMILQAVHDALAGAGSRCPLAPEQIACAMSAADRNALLADLDDALQGCVPAQARGLSPVGAPDLSPVAALDAAIAMAEEMNERIKARRLALARQEDLERECAALAGSLEDYELLVKAFGPDGIRVSSLAGSLGPFTARVNENLADLTDGAYAVEFAPDLSPIVSHAGAAVPARLLSTSEQMRVGIAIQEAIAAHLGLRFLAIDGADLLDQDNRDLLTGFVCDRAEAGEFDQVLVFSTVGDVPPANPGLPGVKMFWVEDGRVREI